MNLCGKLIACISTTANKINALSVLGDFLDEQNQCVS